MKFDVIVGNPPYQYLASDTKTKPLWHKFVPLWFDLLQDGGYLCAVHPGAWRNVAGHFKKTQKEFLDKQFLYLEIHSPKDGLKLFGADIRYDWYVLKNSKPTKPTKIKDEHCRVDMVDISNLSIIPNGMIKEFFSLIAKDGEDRVKVISNYDYGTLKPCMSKTYDDEHIYPCAYYSSKLSGMSCHYSSVSSNGHFGIPKVIFTNGRISSVESIVDKEGLYGMTQFAHAIIDAPEVLDDIKKALDNENFRKLMMMCSFDGHFNPQAIELFRKDFWKDYV